MQSSFYLYCNSPASSEDGEKGWVGKYPNQEPKKALRKHKFGYRMHTTKEYAFAEKFDTQREAEDFVKKYKLCCIIFERRDNYGN
jgi:hypothetical protein